MGLTDVALALLCQSDANRRAVEATGHLCPGTTAPLARSNVAPAADATVADAPKDERAEVAPSPELGY